MALNNEYPGCYITCFLQGLIAMIISGQGEEGLRALVLSAESVSAGRGGMPAFVSFGKGGGPVLSG